MNDSSTVSKAQLHWQCRRGMRELDVLLSGWLERHFDHASDSQKAEFSALLQLPDPQLAGYLLLGKPVSSPGAADVIEQIRGNTSP